VATANVLVLRDLLRAALRDELPDGWFYLPESSKPDLATPVLLITDAGDLEDDGSGIPAAALASDRGFPLEGLDTATLVSVAQGATEFAMPPPDELLLEAFLYYLEFDAYLPSPGAPNPPSRREIEHDLDRKFYDSLGPERADVPCREAGCTRGAIAYSVLCRPHHFENVKRKVPPFRD
jgi:hypothetical protein